MALQLPRGAPEEAQDAHPGRILTTLLLAVLATYVIVGFMAWHWRDWALVSIAGAGALLLAVPAWLLRRGRVRAASLVMVLSVIFTVTIIATIGQGIRDLALIVYPIVFVFAALTLDRASLGLCVGLTLVAIVWLALGEAAGWFVTKPLLEHSANLHSLTVVAVLLLVAALAVDLLSSSARKSLERALREIEQRKRTEKARQYSERRLTDVIFSSNDWVWEIDENGVYTYSSGKGHSYFGPSREDIIGKTPFDFMPPEEAERVGAMFRQIAADKAPIRDLENWNTTRSGERICLLTNGVPILDETGNLTGYRGVDKDITERERAQQKSRQLAELLDCAPCAVMVSDFDGRISYANQRALDLHGYDREEFQALDLRQVVAVESRDMIAPRILALREHGVASFVTMHLKKDGSSVPLEIQARVTTWGDRSVLIGVGVDLTERIAAQKEKDLMEARLRQAEKMESVGRLAGGVAHDFNNALAVILGHAEFAMGQVDPAHPLRTDLEEIRKAANRSADLTRQLLAFARRQTVAPAVIDLNKTVVDMLSMLERIVGENVRLTWQPGDELWSVRVDPSQIGQMLTNLCANARDAIADVGTIGIATGNRLVDPGHCAGRPGFVPGEYVLITVSDNGGGMAEETLAHVFEPFFTTKGLGKGTGLGLAMVYGAVKQNNGFIEVDSGMSRGTCVSIYLPRLAGEPGGAPTPTPAPGGPLEGGREGILLVEDEPAVLALARRMLEARGYRVFAASTPAEALRLAREHGSGIDLLVTDVIMPEMNGRELAETLSSVHPGLKCLYTSGYAAEVIGERGMVAESVPFIRKPFSSEGLAAKVREMLDGR